ncbi:MAG: efflux transporter outer membrane subunit [Rhodoferax sp.]|nr:efflux transporter outer membrane subunit [Rhodoferax sp.]
MTNTSSGHNLGRSTPLPLVCALLLGLAGCSAWSPPSQEAGKFAIPSQWPSASVAHSTPTISLTDWWLRFNDPQLTTLITQALQANTSVRSAQAALQQARALRDVNAAGLSPSLSASGSAQRGKSGDSDTSNSLRAGLDARWEIDVFGARRSSLNASEADAQASQASLADVQVSIAAEVALAYIQLRGQQAQLQIARNNLASQQETLQITDWRLQAGLTTSLELEQARTATEQTSAQLPTLQTGINQSRLSLALLTGQTPDALQGLISQPQPMPTLAGNWALGIPAHTLRQRPDVRAAEQRIRAALSRVSAADAARYPGFALSGSVGLNALSLSGLTSGASVASALLGSISVPLLDGGAARAQVRVQEAALEQARVAYEAVVLTALKDVEGALVALQGDRARQLNLQNAATAAANAALLAQQRYTSGLIDFQTVLQTQRTLLTAQDSVASVQAAISTDHVRLVKALGGGWNQTSLD